jgi:drug/metabolite transporter (DMT)-like permease
LRGGTANGEAGGTGMKVHLLFPLLSSLLYVVGVLFMKQCASRGVGVWRTSFVVNLATAVLFVPVLAFGGVWRPWADHWQPAVTGLLFIGGQTLTLVALRHGDVSVATPVMGLKTVLVALLVPLILGEPVSGKVWWAAAMSAGGIGLLNLVRGARHHHVGSTLLLRRRPRSPCLTCW